MQYSTTPKHKYNLRSKPNIILPDKLIANYIFDYAHSLNYIYTPEGKREVVNTLITSKSKDV